MLPAALSPIGASGTTILSFTLTVHRYFVPLALLGIILLSYSMVSTVSSLGRACLSGLEDLIQDGVIVEARTRDEANRGVLREEHVGAMSRPSGTPIACTGHLGPPGTQYPVEFGVKRQRLTSGSTPGLATASFDRVRKWWEALHYVPGIPGGPGRISVSKVTFVLSVCLLCLPQ